MDTEKNKKIRAAIAGVIQYMKSEEESRRPEPLVTPAYPVPWSLQARQTMMQMRYMVQRRVLKR